MKTKKLIAITLIALFFTAATKLSTAQTNNYNFTSATEVFPTFFIPVNNITTAGNLNTQQDLADYIQGLHDMQSAIQTLLNNPDLTAEEQDNYNAQLSALQYYTQPYEAKLTEMQNQ